MDNPYSNPPNIDDLVRLPEGGDGTIIKVVRPNSFDHWCVVVQKEDNSTDTADVGYDAVLAMWKAKEYVPVRFPDLDGVMKKM